MAEAQIESTGTRATRAERAEGMWWWVIIPSALLVLGLVLAYILATRPPEGCKNFNQVPIESGVTAQNPPQPWSIFQVPESSFVVLSRDGFYSVGEPGERFGKHQGIYTCSSYDAAVKAAANLNKKTE